MANYILEIEDEIDFELIAIRSILPDYQLAYVLNKQLKIQLGRSRKDLDVQFKRKGEIFHFTYFEYYDEKDFKEFQLIKNSSFEEIVAITQHTNYLFEEIQESKPYLLKELKGFDFIIKQRGFEQAELLEIIKKIKPVQYALNIDVNTIKSINYINF